MELLKVKIEDTSSDVKFNCELVVIKSEETITNLCTEEINIKEESQENEEEPITENFKCVDNEIDNYDYRSADNFEIKKVDCNPEGSKERTLKKNYICHICNYKAPRETSLKNHIKIHDGGKFHECNICSFKTVYKSRLNRHIIIHTDDKPYSCNLCNYKGVRKAGLVDHMRRLHAGENPFHVKQPLTLQHHTSEKVVMKCNNCTYTTTRKDTLRTHMLIHTEGKPFKCTICDFKTKHRRALKTHLTAHTGATPFECHSCNYKCSNKKVLLIHMRLHTGVARAYSTLQKYAFVKTY